MKTLFQKKMEIKKWHIDSRLEKDLAEHYQARRAAAMKVQKPLDIIRQYTFSYGAPSLSLNKVSGVFDLVEKILGKKISGIGLEVGAGPGTHAALLAKRFGVERVYAVEGSEAIVQNLMNVVVPHITGSATNKVIGVVGEFDNLELPDSSIDFVFDFFSLHHSGDLKKTLSEIYRVLKPGGFLFCFDKARDDKLSRADLESLLDQEYNNEFKQKMGVPTNQRHTRRMNGEHEYRRQDWLNLFNEVGFSRTADFNLARTKSQSKIVEFLKTAFSYLPPKVQVLVTNLLNLFPTSNISSKNRVYSPLINNYHKEISLLAAFK